MVKEKKKRIALILTILLILTGTNILYYIYIEFFRPLPTKELPKFINFGVFNGPRESDPQYMTDSVSYDMAYQIWEGLFAPNLSDPDTPLIPKLALDFGTWSGNNYTVCLRQNINFTDGTPFNATAVKFTFDRLSYLINATGEQNIGDTSMGESAVKYLYVWVNDSIPILNKTEIIDNNTVKFVLNRPFGAWVSLLTHPSSLILNPRTTPARDYISVGMATASGSNMIGTGPWIFEYYLLDIELRFHRNDNYWLSPCKIERLNFIIFQSIDTLNIELLDGNITILDSPHYLYYNAMRDDPDIILYEAGTNVVVRHLGFNNKFYNVTWRNAMSWAINYSHMITNIYQDRVVRLKSPIPLGIQFANCTFESPTYNLTKAREYMQSMGYGVDFTTNTQWQAASFLIVNFTYVYYQDYKMLTLLQDNLDLIGIDVLDDQVATLTEFLKIINGIPPYSKDMLDLYWIDWIPDYNDPNNYLNSLMSNISLFNSAQINDSKLEQMLLNGILELNQSKRKVIYWDMQKYIVEDLRPWAFGFVGKNYDAFIKELKGYPSNAMGFNYFYPCYFEA